MSYSFTGPNGKVVFSDDHQYTTHMWLIRDGANSTFRDYIDKERMFGLKLTQEGYTRTRAMAAIYMLPRKNNEYFEKIDRTLHWASSTMETSECIGRVIGTQVENLRKDLKPNPEKWEALFQQHGPHVFEEGCSLLRNRFPQLVQEEGARIGSIIRERARGLQQGKQQGFCKRGEPAYNSGSNAVFVLIEPMLSAAIENLTGLWPMRPVAPAEGFHLEFEGGRLLNVEQKWLKLETGSEKIYAA